MINLITQSDFERIAFKIVDFESQSEKKAYPSGCLAIINAVRDKNIWMCFKHSDQESYIYCPNLPLGRSLTIFSDPRNKKSYCLTEETILDPVIGQKRPYSLSEALSKLEIIIGEVTQFVIQKEQFSIGYFANVEVIVKDNQKVQCLIPNICPEFVLRSKKIVLLINLMPACCNESIQAHVFCGSDHNHNWIPFILTNESIPIGTKATFQ
jgi:hypothetical protein